MEENGRLAFGTSLSNEELKRSGEEAKGVFRDISKTASAEGAKIDSSFRKIGAAIGGYFSARAAADFARQIVNVRKEIESLEVSFRTLLGSEEKANSLLGELREFAVKTPLQLNDLAKSAQTLLSFNVEAEKVMPTLKAIGDISMGDSQKLQSLTLAFAQMRSTGKLMGQDLLQMINAGFNPLTVMAEKTGKSVATLKDEMSKGAISADMVADAFMSATSQGGKFYGMLEKQSKTLSGSFSNLQGAVTDMMNELGEKMQGPLSKTLDVVMSVVKNYEKIGRIIADVAIVYGTYKAAVVTVTAVQKVADEVAKGYTVTQQIQLKLMKAQEVAQKALNKTMLSNPYVMIAAAVAAMAVAMVSLYKAQNKSVEAHKKFNKELEKQKSLVDSSAAKFDFLVSKLNAAKKGTDEYRVVLKNITDEYGEYLTKLGIEAEKLKDLKEKQKLLREEIIKTSKTKAKGALLAGAEEQYNDMVTNARELIRKNLSKLYTEGSAEYVNAYNKVLQLIAKGEKQNTATFDYSSFFEGSKKGYYPKKVDIIGAVNSINDAGKVYQQQINSIMTVMDVADKEVEDKLTQLRKALARAETSAEKASIQKQINELTAQQQTVKNKKYWEDQVSTLMAQREALENTAENKTIIADLEAKILKAQAEVDKYNPKKTASSNQSLENEEAQQRKRQQQLARIKEQYDKQLEQEQNDWLIEAEQARIDTMKEGLQKTLDQIELDYKRQEDLIKKKENEMLETLRDLKEQEWEAANPDKVKQGYMFDRSSVTKADLTDEQRKQLLDYGTIALEERRRKEKEALDGSIADIGTYLQKRQRILEEYKRREEELYEEGTLTYDASGNITGGTMRDGVSQGNLDELNRQRDEALKEVDNEIASRSATFNRWLDNISGMTVRQLRTMLEAAKKALKQLESDPSADPQKLAEARAIVQKLEEEIKNADLSPTEEALEEWSRYCDAVGEAGDALKSLGDTMEGTAGDIISRLGTIFSYTSKAINGIIDMTQKSMESVEDVSKATSKALQAASSAVAILAIIQAIYTVVNELKNLIDDYGNTDSGIGKFFSDFLHYLTDSETMLENLAYSLLGPIGTIIGVLTSNNTNSKRKEHKKDVEGLIDEYDKLGKSVEELGRQSRKTFGESNAEIQRQQIELKKAQIELLNTAIAEEQAQKKPDEDKINEWQDTIERIESEIEDLGEAAVDAIFGQDISSAIESFAEAMTNAWSQGVNGAENAKDAVRRQMRMMVQEAIKDAIESGEAMARIRAKLAEFWDDEIFTPDEITELEQMAENLQQQIDQQFGWATSLFDESSREGSRKGIATASQESVDELNGRMTAVQGHTFSINENTVIIRDNVAAILGSVRRIERNTDELTTIRATINDIQTHGVRIRQ